MAAGSPARFSICVAGSPGEPIDAQHGAAIVLAPDGAVRRQRIGPIALVAVDRRRGERRRRRGVIQQARPDNAVPTGLSSSVSPAKAFSPLFLSRSDWCRCQPLDITLGRRGRHMKLAMIAVAAADLLRRAAEQDHVVGGRHAGGGGKGELDLARPELDLERAQRQVERGEIAAQNLEHRIELVVAQSRSDTDSPGSAARLRRIAGLARLAGVARTQARIVELENVELDFEPGEELVARRRPAARPARDRVAACDSGIGRPSGK